MYVLGNMSSLLGTESSSRHSLLVRYQQKSNFKFMLLHWTNIDSASVTHTVWGVRWHVCVCACGGGRVRACVCSKHYFMKGELSLVEDHWSALMAPVYSGVHDKTINWNSVWGSADFCVYVIEQSLLNSVSHTVARTHTHSVSYLIW